MLREEHVEILVEEASMARFLDQMLPEILPHGFVLGQNCFVRPHNGKSDLMKSLPRKARGFQYFPQPVRMVVIHDQDSNDCYLLKEHITEQVQRENPNIPRLVRIACRELENWYLGDLDAVEKVYPESKAASQKSKARFRVPDNLHGNTEMKKFTSNFSKLYTASEIPKHMDLGLNKSTSFNHFVAGIQKFLL